MRLYLGILTVFDPVKNKESSRNNSADYYDDAEEHKFSLTFFSALFSLLMRFFGMRA
jgi:hypothetical protein